MRILRLPDDRFRRAPDASASRRARRLVAISLAASLALAACGDDGSPATTSLDLTDFDAIAAAADGQTVRWWLFGGDERINRYLDDEVAPRAAELGVTLERVPITDTADAVNRVAAEQSAGRLDDGQVDLIWINGENFARGLREDLWLTGWADALPNAALLADDDASLTTDFGIDTQGAESPWSRAAFVFGHDLDRTPEPPRTVSDLLTWIEENPGRFTYPAPPDFTGSAFVRLVVAALGEDEAFATLAAIEEDLWRAGQAYPGSEAELLTLFGNGEVDLAMSYAPGFVAAGVETGALPASARPYAFTDGTLTNVSFVTIPANAANVEGALVLADLLLDPELQARKADPAVLGAPSVLPPDLVRAPADAGPYVLDDFGALIAEFEADRVDVLERRWLDEVLRG